MGQTAGTVVVFSEETGRNKVKRMKKRPAMRSRGGIGRV